ncbi:hypothetical protein VNO78_02513 [Psophocarpus tetragonolobus]|uniref:Uncharacterized protein n=1 Tax=Psophocarpus tetragonolobus TaxID=3891 RepID=A0AAN9XV74_PSOTE
MNKAALRSFIHLSPLAGMLRENSFDERSRTQVRDNLGIEGIIEDYKLGEITLEAKTFMESYQRVNWMIDPATAMMKSCQVNTWMVLHGDASIMPNDVLGWLNLIKEGNFEKVDWAVLLLEERVEVVEEENEGKEEEEDEGMEEEVDGSGDVKMGEADEVHV